MFALRALRSDRRKPSLLIDHQSVLSFNRIFWPARFGMSMKEQQNPQSNRLPYRANDSATDLRQDSRLICPAPEHMIGAIDLQFEQPGEYYPAQNQSAHSEPGYPTCSQ